MRKKRFPTRGAEKHLRKKAEGLPKKSGASRVLKEEWYLNFEQLKKVKNQGHSLKMENSY